MLLVVCLSAPSAVLAEKKKYSKSELEQSLVEIELRLKKNPHDMDMLESKVATLEVLGRRSEAEQICESAVKAGVDRPFIWRFLGFCKYKERNWSEALPLFKRAESMGESGSAGFVAFCLRKLHRYDECVKFANEKIQHYPNDAVLYFNRGLARRTLHQSKTLVCADLWKAAQLDPSLIDAHRSICSEEDASK